MKMYFSQTEAKMTPLQVLLSQIMEMAESACPGPWEARCKEFSNSERPTSIWTEYGWLAKVEGLGPSYSVPSAEFIAASRTIVPQLVKCLEKAIEQRNLYCDDFSWREQEDAEIMEILNAVQK